MNLRYPIVIFACSVAWGQYAGPQILSGPANDIGMRGGARSGIRFYAGVSGEVQSGLVPAAVDANGNIIDSNNLYGAQGNLGAYGHKRWKRTDVGLDFNATYRRYSQNLSYNGLDTTLALNVTRQMSRRFTVSFLNVGGAVTQGFSTLYGYTAGPEQVVGVPASSIFDDRTFYWQTAGTVLYQKSARLSYTFGGVGFFVRRKATTLADVNGYGAHGAVFYQLTRRTSAFLRYQYFHFDYPRIFGEADANVLLGGLTHGFSRRWSGSMALGMSRTDTVGVSRVAADPVTAALFGQPTVIRAFNTHKYYPAIQGTLTGAFRRSSLSFMVADMPNPGNGVYLTSDVRTVGATYTYSGLRRASLTAGVSYNQLQSVGQTDLGTYSYVVGNVGVAYRLRGSMHLTANFFVRDLQIESENSLSRSGYGATVGFTFSPGEVPLVFW